MLSFSKKSFYIYLCRQLRHQPLFLFDKMSQKRKQDFDGWTSVMDKCIALTNHLVQEQVQEKKDSNDVNKFIEELEKTERRLQALNERENQHGNN